MARYMWFLLMGACLACLGLIVYGVLNYEDGGMLKVCRGSIGQAVYSDAVECKEICWASPLPLKVVMRSGGDAERVILKRAIGWYNSQLGGKVLAYDKSKNGAIEVWFSQSSPGPQTTHWLNIDNGCVDLVSIYVINVPLVDQQQLFIEHELGRALGLADDRAMNSVMNPVPGKVLFDDDIERLRKAFRL